MVPEPTIIILVLHMRIREAVNVNSENTRIYQIIHPPSDFYEQKETENSKQTKKQQPKAGNSNITGI